jgi:hypothetical protein
MKHGTVLITPYQVACEFQMQLAAAMKCCPLRGEMKFVHVPSFPSGIQVHVDSLGAIGVVRATFDELTMHIEDLSDRCVMPLVDKLMLERGVV